MQFPSSSLLHTTPLPIRDESLSNGVVSDSAATGVLDIAVANYSVLKLTPKGENNVGLTRQQRRC